jgi:hypothetical protein
MTENRALEALVKTLPPARQATGARGGIVARLEVGLRALRDLRRYAPNVTIQTAGPVNVGGTQVNQVNLEAVSRGMGPHHAG